MNADNVKSFVRLPDGSLRFKYIVEGANLFFTQVRCRLHRRPHCCMPTTCSAGLNTSPLSRLEHFTLVF